MNLRTLPWGKIALGAAALMLMATPTQFPDRWAKARLLHPDAQPRFLALLQAIEALGYRVLLTSSWRAGGTDPHAYGLALDLNIIHIATGVQYGMKVGRTSKAEWEATGVPALIRRLGFRWGGDFVTPWPDLQGNLHAAYDPVHVDDCKRNPTAQLAKRVTSLLDRRKVKLLA
jgi:hypothetical protein